MCIGVAFTVKVATGFTEFRLHEERNYGDKKKEGRKEQVEQSGMMGKNEFNSRRNDWRYFKLSFSGMTFFLSFFFFLPGYMMHALLALTGLVLPEMQFLLYNG